MADAVRALVELRRERVRVGEAAGPGVEEPGAEVVAPGLRRRAEGADGALALRDQRVEEAVHETRVHERLEQVGEGLAGLGPGGAVLPAVQRRPPRDELVREHRAGRVRDRGVAPVLGIEGRQELLRGARARAQGGAQLRARVAVQECVPRARAQEQRREGRFSVGLRRLRRPVAVARPEDVGLVGDAVRRG